MTIVVDPLRARGAVAARGHAGPRLGFPTSTAGIIDGIDGNALGRRARNVDRYSQVDHALDGSIIWRLGRTSRARICRRWRGATGPGARQRALNRAFAGAEQIREILRPSEETPPTGSAGNAGALLRRAVAASEWHRKRRDLIDNQPEHRRLYGIQRPLRGLDRLRSAEVLRRSSPRISASCFDARARRGSTPTAPMFLES